MLSYSSTIQTDLKVYNSVFITDHPLYASTIKVGKANVIPVAYPDAYNVDQNGVLTVTVINGVLSNDVDTDNLLTAELVSDVSNGTLILNADGSFTYTPNELYYGQDSFTYRVFDRKAYSNIETVIITVNQVITWNELITNTHEDRVVADGGTVSDLEQLKTDLDVIGETDYNNTSLILLPSGGSKIGKIHAIKPEDGTADLTVDRNSTASYVAEDGSIKFANANEPRFDWSSGKPALLVEPQRTNLIDYSEDFTGGYYTLRTLNYETGHLDPMGGNNALKVTITNNDGAIYRAGFPIDETKQYTLSVWLRADTDMTGGISLSTTVSPYTKAVNITTEWQRFTLTATPNTGATTVNVHVLGGYNGFKNGDVVYMWGAQFEEGFTATSYIKTEGSTKTRLKDNITVAPPAGTTQIIETIDGVEQTPITTIPATYEVSEGNINQIKML